MLPNGHPPHKKQRVADYRFSDAKVIARIRRLLKRTVPTPTFTVFIRFVSELLRNNQTVNNNLRRAGFLYRTS